MTKPMRQFLVGFAILLVLAFGLIAGAGYLLIRATCGEVTTTEPITRTTSLTLPKSTRVLGGTWIMAPMKVELYAKVSMPSADALAFAKQPGFEPLAPGDYFFPEYAEAGMKERGWSQGRVEDTFSTRKMSHEDGDELGATYLLLDRTDPQTTMVYIFRNW